MPAILNLCWEWDAYIRQTVHTFQQQKCDLIQNSSININCSNKTLGVGNALKSVSKNIVCLHRMQVDFCTFILKLDARKGKYATEFDADLKMKMPVSSSIAFVL